MKYTFKPGTIIEVPDHEKKTYFTRLTTKNCDVYDVQLEVSLQKNGEEARPFMITFKAYKGFVADKSRTSANCSVGFNYKVYDKVILKPTFLRKPFKNDWEFTVFDKNEPV